MSDDLALDRCRRVRRPAPHAIEVIHYLPLAGAMGSRAETAARLVLQCASADDDEDPFGHADMGFDDDGVAVPVANSQKDNG